MRKRPANTLYCFSPPVMVATFAIELALAAYTLVRYKVSRLGNLAIAMFVSLAIFQLAEYKVCGGLGLNAQDWARLGFVAITLLPVLGIHMVYAIHGTTNRKIIGLSYAYAAAFVAYFLLGSSIFTGHQCMGNYVIFQLSSKATILYSMYYYGLLLCSVILGISFARQSKGTMRKSFEAFVVGYALFILPTATVNVLDPNTTAGIPSIMCGFAVVLALVMAFAVLPLRLKPR